MSTNDYRPHIHIIPEDRATEQIANGFLTSLSLNNRSVQVLNPQHGWPNVRALLNDRQFRRMRSARGKQQFLVLVIDFDKKTNRLADFQQRIPDDLVDRIFILGSESNPEKLQKALKMSLEHIGQHLAEECHDGSYRTWDHDLLKRSRQEIDRMDSDVKAILFQDH